MASNGSKRLILAASFALAITCSSFTPTAVNIVMAQVTPVPVQDMAWVRCGSDFYIEGGYVAVNGAVQSTSPQHFALDLSTSWSVTSPPWRALTNGTPSRTSYGVSLPNNQTTLTFKFMAPSAYTITAYDLVADCGGDRDRVGGYIVTVTEYSPTKNTWSTLPTSGSPPSPSADLCSAISEDGATIVVFGGRTSVVTPTFTGALHILDISSGVWTAGPPQSTPRIYAACVLVGDQFVVWGGSNDANNTLTSVQPLVYDVTLKQWANSYKAPAYYLNNPPPKPNPSSGSGSGAGSGSGGNGSGNNAGGPGLPSSTGDSSSSSSGGLGPIIGGVAGGLAVIGAIIGFLIYRRRQNKNLEDIREQLSQQRMVVEAERSRTSNFQR
ncbi:MAG: hypothetical protein J3R72DRAFT_472213 [Linnemannia gamsii]|nr:MAG: hypothetical protein J3R72DRAFT_472213 [Linnemannia gamsii]